MKMNEKKFVEAIKEIDDTLDICLCSIAWDCLKVAPHNNYAFTQLCAYIEMFGAKAGEDMDYFCKWVDVKEWLKDHFYNDYK